MVGYKRKNAETSNCSSKKSKAVRQPRIPKGSVMYSKGRVTSGPQGPEVKFFDTIASAATASTTTPLMVDLTASMPEGLLSNNRIGVRIKVQSIYIKANVRCADAAGASSQAHWALVLDKQQNGTATAVNLIFTNSSTNNVQQNNTYYDRFKVLAVGDSSQRMFPGTFLGDNFTKYVPAAIDVRYSDTTGPAFTNGLYFVVTTDATVGNPVQIDYCIRIRYTDE